MHGNPYVWDSDSSTIDSPKLTDLKLFDSEDEPIDAGYFDGPVEIWLPRNTSEPIGNINVTYPLLNGKLTHHKFTPQINFTEIHFEASVVINMTMYIKSCTKPTPKSYDIKLDLKNGRKLSENLHVQTSTKECPHSFVSIFSSFDQDTPIGQRMNCINYTLDVQSSQCVYWNETKNLWSTEGCQV